MSKVSSYIKILFCLLKVNEIITTFVRKKPGNLEKSAKKLFLNTG
jgi:hypothetical protein